MKKRTVKLISLLLVLALAIGALAACGKKAEEPKEEGEATQEETQEESEGAYARPTEDREGNAITIPEEVNKIVVVAPSIMEVIDSLGARDLVVGVDTYTPFSVEGLDSLPQFDMMSPDVEGIAALEPDIVFTTGMSYVDGDPYTALKDLGICVVVIPSSASLEAIKEDIIFTGQCISEDAKAKAEEVVAEFQAQLDEVAAIGETITEKKTVAFEVAALPYLCVCGKDTFIDEMITLIGAENVYGDQESWYSVSEEDAVSANPDVILTSVDYLEVPGPEEVLARPGWENVTAVANKDVYYIDSNASNRPNQNVIKALWEMAAAVYPEAYAELEQAA